MCDGYGLRNTIINPNINTPVVTTRAAFFTTGVETGTSFLLQVPRSAMCSTTIVQNMSNTLIFTTGVKRDAIFTTDAV